MMRSEKGVTMIALVVTIVALLIIAVVSITQGTQTVTEVENKKTMTELSNVQQAIFERYVLLKSYGSERQVPTTVITDDIILDDDIDRPLELLGTRIASNSNLEKYGFINYKITYTTDMPYESYYYLLAKEDLNELGISEKNSKNENYSYIVNYSTGEVFDLEHIIYIDEYSSGLGENAELSGTTTKLEEDTHDFTE